MDEPATHPTTSDISMLMKDLGFKWSNEGQIYYHEYNYEHLESNTAEAIYQKLVGRKPYNGVLRSLDQ